MHRPLTAGFVSRRVALIAAFGSALLFCALAAALAAGTASAGSPYDRVLTVGFDADVTPSERADARRDAGVTARAALSAPGLQQVDVPSGKTLAEAAAELRADPSVDFVELPGFYRKSVDDPYYPYLWALHNSGQVFAQYCAVETEPCPLDEIRPLSGSADADIDALEAWSLFAGGSEPIAVVDTGVAYQHQDLAANIWSNTAEAGGVSAVDDDPYMGTGSDGVAASTPRSYVDDVRGWDFIGHLSDNGTPADPLDDEWVPDNDPSDEDGHGTHVAGIAAADSNLSGGVGVNPQAKIMPLRAGDANGIFPFGAIEEAFSYAVDHGARVVNASFGGTTSSPGMEAIITANPQTLFVVAAGNHGNDHESGGASRIYPCDISAPNIICVAASDYHDGLADFSDYGHPSVDIAAPGKAILSTVPDGTDPAAGGDDDYGYFDGTSMAAPFVAGAASLIWSAYPTLSSSQIKTLLVTKVDEKNGLVGKVGFGGRLNVHSALDAAASPPSPGWPVTPDPPEGSGGGGSGGGGTGDSGTTPIAPLPPTVQDTEPPALHVVSARKQREGWNGVVRLNVICGEGCAISVRARPNVRGAQPLRRSYSSSAGQARTIKLRFTGATLRKVRAALKSRRRIGVFVSVSVADSSGNRATPKSFRVSLMR